MKAAPGSTTLEAMHILHIPCVHTHFRQLNSFSVTLTGYKTALQLLRALAKRCSTCQRPSRSEVQRVPQSPPKRRGMLQIVFARLPAVQTFSTVIFFVLLLSHYIYGICVSDLPRKIIICVSSGVIYICIYIHNVALLHIRWEVYLIVPRRYTMTFFSSSSETRNAN